jgi:diguanylate cyclase (GGDEF)-like protein
LGLIFKDLNILRSTITAISTSVEVKGMIESAGANLPNLFNFCSFGVLWRERSILYLFQEESCPPAFTQEVVKNMVKVFSILGEEPIEIEQIALQVEKRKLRPNPFMMDPQATLKSHLTLPLSVEGEIIGCISINSDQPNAFDAQKLQFFSVIGYQMAASLRHLQRLSTVKKEAIYDTLTGLVNRRYCEERLSAETQKAFTGGSNLSVIMVDIDHFKKVNDTFGHAGGDQVLREIASLLKNSVRRQDDTVARYGGEEFVLVLPGAPLEAASTIAERIRQSIENNPFNIGQTQIHLTISLGISNFPTHPAKSKEELVKIADLALYEAKRGGRNRVCIFNSTLGRNG